MQFAVSDTAAIAFARGFYTAIAHGRGVDEAARSGRISILGAPRSLEWVTPVLYVRGEATQLFTLIAPAAGSRETPSGHRAGAGDRPPAVAQSTKLARRRRAELRALYVEARAELRLEHFDTAVSLFDDLLTLDPDYFDAAGLRDTAERSRQLADTYTLAVAAEDAGDWAAAVVSYGEVLGADAAYRDAAARKGACEARQRVADLQAELRHHAGAGQWQAVLEVDAELTCLDPSLSDPDGLAARARTALDAEQSAADLERRYAQAYAAEDSGDWTAGIHGYDEILEIDPAYRDTAARRDLCRQRDQVAVLQSELEEQAAAKDWPQVLAIIKKLDGIDPAVAAEPSYTELAARARLELAIHPAEPLGRTDLDATVYAVSSHPGRLRIATADGASARVYDISGKEHREQSAVRAGGRKSRVLAVAFSPDGTRLATGSTDNSARVWDAASGRKLLEVRHDNAVTTVAFSPDGTQLATGSTDNSARVWDAASGRKLLEVRHDDTVTTVAFSPDGTQLATGSTDNSARVWPVAEL